MTDIHGALLFQREVDRIIKGLEFKSIRPTNKCFREGTEIPVKVQNFYLKTGGMGDNLCQLPALVWLAKNVEHVYGRVFIASILVEVFQNIITQTGNVNWKVQPIERFEELVEHYSSTRGRAYIPKDGHANYQFANGCGGRLVDVGFIDINMFPPPEGADVYPQIDFSLVETLPKVPPKYVVLTTGAVSPAREVSGRYWNPVIDHILAKGFTPLFLGSEKVVEINVRYSKGCNYSKGIDLRGGTTVMEAAWFLKNAAAVIGLDNGLIQLASFTDANIICAYNMVHPRHRVPKRPSLNTGRWETIFVPHEELACTGCQSEMYFIAPPHDFKRCLYGDLKCIDLLFKDDALRFRSALDRILA